MTANTDSRAFAETHSVPKFRVLLNDNLLQLPAAPFRSGDTLYVPLRAVSESAGAEVKWLPNEKLATVVMGGKTLTPTNVKLVGDTMMASADFFGEKLGLTWKAYTEGSVVAFYTPDSGKKPDEQLTGNYVLNALADYNGYSRDDLKWLAKIVHAEANGETFESKLAVASVVRNRVESRIFPQTIKEVIFDRKNGVQFTPTVNGAINKEPSVSSYLAALDALEGRNNAEAALFFINPVIAKTKWVQSNREFAFKIGGHNFYY